MDNSNSLPNVGARIRWFGNEYTVVAVEQPDMVVVERGNKATQKLQWTGGPGNTIVYPDGASVIDQGCSTLDGLRARCSMFESIYGKGKVYNHPDGFMYEGLDGSRILVELPTKPA